jgi:glycosidase
MVKKGLFLYLLSILLVGCGDDKNATKNPNTGTKFYDEPFQKIPALEDIVMYETNQRVFAQQNSFNAITARLDEIRALGVNVIWLMPVNEQGKEKAFGSPYCVKNYLKTEPEYGTLDDLRRLVKEAHNREMAVIIDWVANHTSWDNPWLSNNPSWYTQDANGNVGPPAGTGWNDVVDLNYNNQNMRASMIDAMQYWIREANVDGFRCDAADFVPADFWKEAIHKLRNMQEGRKLILLAEGTEVNNWNAGFDMDYGWNFCDVLEEVYSDKKLASDLYRSKQGEYETIPSGKQKLRFSTNHDRMSENSLISHYKSQQGALSAFVIAATMGGVPLIYSSQEVGYPDRLSFFAFRSVDWKANPEIYNAYKKLMEIRSNTPAFRKGNIQTFSHRDIVNFCRWDATQIVYVAVNVRNTTRTLNIPADWIGVTCKNLLDGSVVTLPETIEIPAHEYLIFSK